MAEDRIEAAITALTDAHHAVGAWTRDDDERLDDLIAAAAARKADLLAAIAAMSAPSPGAELPAELVSLSEKAVRTNEPEDEILFEQKAAEWFRTLASRQSAAPQDKAEGSWQPISTAPVTDMILGVVDGAVRLVRWGKTSHVPLYGWCLEDQGPENADLCQPTHWMPLPAPPAAGEPR